MILWENKTGISWDRICIAGVGGHAFWTDRSWRLLTCLPTEETTMIPILCIPLICFRTASRVHLCALDAQKRGVWKLKEPLFTASS
jgi:hypothetical protein